MAPWPPPRLAVCGFSGALGRLCDALVAAPSRGLAVFVFVKAAFDPPVKLAC